MISAMSIMEPNQSFKEFLKRFNDFGIEYLIVGGYALAMHGAPRFTKDLDLLVRPTRDNAERIISFLTEMGFSSLGCTVDEFSRPDTILQLGEYPLRIDLLTGLGGVTWDEAVQGKVEGDYGGVPVFFIGRKAFIASKRSAGRLQDLADIEAIGGDEKA